MVKKIVLAVAVMALGIALSAPPSAATMYLVKIPDVRNTPKAEAEKVLKAKGFQVAFVEGPAQMSTQIGKVIDQKPAGGGYFYPEKPKTLLVTLTIASQGSFVPMVLLMKEAEAAAAVKKAGFVPKVEYVPEENAAMIGKVRNTVPAPHLKLAPGGTVTLQVGSAAHAMPNFVGSHAQGARQSIDQLNRVKPMGLKTTVVQGRTTTVAQDDQKIYEQSPPAGTALKAGAEMARFNNDTAAAEEYMKIFAEGEKYCDSKLFNGEYYIQLPPPFDKAPINQVGTGCLIDQLVGLEIARIAGISNYLDNTHVKSALRSIFKYNFKTSMREHENYQRLYAVNDEGATVICTWPKGGRPDVPFPYADEVMNGFEYQFAVHCILEDLLEEGLTAVKAIRDRFDGYGRNPWDEFECGHHYARSMASYGLIIALSGFEYDKGNGFIGFNPKLHKDNFKTFWSLDSVWGTYSLTKNHAELSVLYGEFDLSSIRLDASVSNKQVSVTLESAENTLKGIQNGKKTAKKTISAQEPIIISSDSAGLLKFSKTMHLSKNSVLKFSLQKK